jgi:polysaccharide export outer membrane protein
MALQGPPAGGAQAYVLAPGDLLEIKVLQAPEVGGTVRVGPSGTVALALVGELRAQGLSLREFEAALTEALRRYIRQPLVQVVLKEPLGQRVSVLGEVARPGLYSLLQGRALVDVLSMAGGLGPEAGPYCLVQRPGVGTIRVALQEALQGGFILQPGDVLHVPRARGVFVLGAVNKPGRFILRGRTSLGMLLGMARGLKPQASKGRIRIYRSGPGGGVLEVNYGRILRGLQEDVPLRDGDVVLVPTDPVKGFLTGFLDTIRGFFTFSKGL